MNPTEAMLDKKLSGTTTPPPPPPPLGPEPAAPAARPITGPAAPVVRMPKPPPKKPVYAIEIAPGVYIQHWYFIVLKSGLNFEAQSDELLPTALIAEAAGNYEGKLLSVPDHYWFNKDLIPRAEVQKIHIVAKRVPGQVGIEASEL